MRTELLTILQGRAIELISRFSCNQEAELFKQHGLPASSFLEVHTIDEMQGRLFLLEGMARGEKAVLETRVISHQEAKQSLARWLA